jgi:hypothetical protein
LFEGLWATAARKKDILADKNDAPAKRALVLPWEGVRHHIN